MATPITRSQPSLAAKSLIYFASSKKLLSISVLDETEKKTFI
jgi:hypothetical protein